MLNRRSRITKNEYRDKIVPAVNKLWPQFTKRWNEEVYAAVWLCIYPFYLDTILDALHIHYSDSTKFKPDWDKIREHCRRVIEDCTSKKKETRQETFVREWSELYHGWNMPADENYLHECRCQNKRPALWYDKIQPALNALATKTKAICQESKDREQKSKREQIKEIVNDEIASREAII